MGVEKNEILRIFTLVPQSSGLGLVESYEGYFRKENYQLKQWEIICGHPKKERAFNLEGVL